MSKFFAVVLVLLLSSCFIGQMFDKACIEGRLSVEQAIEINKLKWQKCPSYRKECRAELNDRVIKQRCSEISRKIFYWYKETE